MNYPTQQSAQGLASLGRNGDSMLVHMTPREVSGLQSLAMAQGGSLTINPDTGLPEASFLGGLFDFVAPVAAGFFGMDPFLVAGLMGGKKFIETGDIGQSALSAFGSYGGAKMGSGFKSFSAPPSIPTAELNTFEQAASNVDKVDPKNLMQVDKTFGTVDTTPFNQIGTQGVGVNLGQSPQINQVLNQAPGGSLGYPSFSGPVVPTEVFGKVPSAPGVDLASNATRGVQIPGATEATSSIGQFGDAITTAAKDPVGFAKEIGGGSAGLGAAKIGMYAASPFTGDLLNPPVTEMATSDAERYDPNRRLYLGNDTGLRLLPNLNLKTAKEGGEIRSYAVGGTVTTGGLKDLYATTDSPANPQLSRDGYGIGRLDSLANAEAMNTAKVLGYADGGKVTDWKDFVKTPSVADLSPFGAGTIATSEDGGKTGNTYAAFDQLSPLQKHMMGIQFMDSPDWKRNQTVAPDVNTPMALNLKTGQQEPQMAKGGYLDGQGDGMSDSIPATIEGKQPARLADGEFVIPADVVSHLGNGSSKAGSKRLYAMLDKVRKARTGHTKQGKQIKPEKYMPA